MDADQLLRDGDLDGARSALVETVRSNPADARARMFRVPMVAVAGNGQGAHASRGACTHRPEARMLATVYSIAMKAEEQRAAIFAGRERMPVIRGAWVEGLADAIMHFAKGDTAKDRRRVTRP